MQATHPPTKSWAVSMTQPEGYTEFSLSSSSQASQLHHIPPKFLAWGAVSRGS